MKAQDLLAKAIQAAASARYYLAQGMRRFGKDDDCPDGHERSSVSERMTR